MCSSDLPVTIPHSSTYCCSSYTSFIYHYCSQSICFHYFIHLNSLYFPYIVFTFYPFQTTFLNPIKLKHLFIHLLLLIIYIIYLPLLLTIHLFILLLLIIILHIILHPILESIFLIIFSFILKLLSFTHTTNLLPYLLHFKQILQPNLLLS